MAGSKREVRPGVWELRVYLGRTPDGRVRHHHVRFRGGVRAADRELARLVSKQSDECRPLDEGPTRWDSSTTVNDAIRAWRANGWEDLSPNTTKRYESIWCNHVEQTIGRRKIATLGPYDVERFLRRLKSSGQSEASVRQTRAMLHRACRLARRWSGNRLPNPVADTEMPDWSLLEKSEPVRAPEPDEVRSLLRTALELDLRLATFIRTVAATGARRAEVCGIRWDSIDWSEGAIKVDRSVVAVKGGTVVRAPKTRASIRIVAVDKGTLDLLRALRVEQEELADACGMRLSVDGFVFSIEPGGGKAPHPDSMTTAFSRVRDAAGLSPDLHLHSLRHFQATTLDPVISEAQKQVRLGWSTVQMARHYTDGLSMEDRRAADHVGRILDGDPERG